MERISSSTTAFYKSVFLILWPVLFGLGTVMMFIRQQPQRWVFAAALVGGTAFFWSFIAGLKDVHLQGGHLVIRSFRKEVVVPVSQIAAVHQNVILSIKPVTIQLREATPFGRRIVFMPPLSFRLFREDDVVHRLRSLARAG